MLPDDVAEVLLLLDSLALALADVDEEEADAEVDALVVEEAMPSAARPLLKTSSSVCGASECCALRPALFTSMPRASPTRFTAICQ